MIDPIRPRVATRWLVSLGGMALVLLSASQEPLVSPLVLGMGVLGDVLGLRRWVHTLFSKSHDPSARELEAQFAHRELKVVTEIPGGERPGRVELDGIEWNARASQTIPAGSKVVVEGRDQLTLLVRTC